VLRRDDAFGAAVREVAQRHALAGELAREGLGTNVVFAVGADRVVKLFPPLWADEIAVERAGLAHVAGRLSVPTPEVTAEGELEGWPYLVLTRVAGVPLARAWGALGAEARERAARRAGELVAEHHALPLPAPGSGVPAPEWPAFLRAQTRISCERLAADPRTRAWAEQLPTFVDALRPELEAAPRVFLNADVTEEHLFVAPDDRGEIVGLVDLADAMVGAPEYDLVSMIPILVEAHLFVPFVAASGLRPTPERLLALALLHRYQESRVLLDLATARASDLALGEVAVALLGDLR
jgi:hygromycin-B 7''-O-kinase